MNQIDFKQGIVITMRSTDPAFVGELGPNGVALAACAGALYFAKREEVEAWVLANWPMVFALAFEEAAKRAMRALRASLDIAVMMDPADVPVEFGDRLEVLATAYSVALDDRSEGYEIHAKANEFAERSTIAEAFSTKQC